MNVSHCIPHSTAEEQTRKSCQVRLGCHQSSTTSLVSEWYSEIMFFVDKAVEISSGSFTHSFQLVSSLTCSISLSMQQQQKFVQIIHSCSLSIHDLCRHCLHVEISFLIIVLAGAWIQLSYTPFLHNNMSKFLQHSLPVFDNIQAGQSLLSIYSSSYTMSQRI